MKAIIAALGALALSAPAYADIFIIHGKSHAELAATGLLAVAAGAVVLMKRR